VTWCLSCAHTGSRRCEGMPVNPNAPGKHIDPRTGIAPICEWGNECARGFVSDARFARPGDRVIERTNRATTRKWLAVQA